MVLVGGVEVSLVVGLAAEDGHTHVEYSG